MPEKFIESFKNWENVLPAFNKRVRIDPVEKEGDFKIYHYHVEMPGLVRHRSFFNTYYHIDGSEPGEYQFIVSGLGNEDYAKKYERLVGMDVLGMMNIYYMGVYPLIDENGEV